MNQIFLVGLGGFLGAVARFKLSGVIGQHTETWRFPMGTFTVNVLGCLMAGLLAGLATRSSWGQNLYVFIFVGVLGGFTTFSAFGLETVTLIQHHEMGLACANIFLSVTFGLIALWLGLKIA